MTSIHASIPADLRDPALAAKRRGEEAGKTVEDTPHKPTMNAKPTSSSRVVMKRMPHRVMRVQSAHISQPSMTDLECSPSEEEDEKSASKENDPMLSPSPVPTQTPRRPSMVKRPLSDLSTTISLDCEPVGSSSLNSSDQNTLDCAIRAFSKAGPDLGERGENGSVALLADGMISDNEARLTKRVCHEDSKENIFSESLSKPFPERPLPRLLGDHKVAPFVSSKASAPSSLGARSMKGKARVGLRRL